MTLFPPTMVMTKRCDVCSVIDTNFVCGVVDGVVNVIPESERVGKHHSFNGLEASAQEGCDLCVVIWQTAIYTVNPMVIKSLKYSGEALTYSASGKMAYFGPKLAFFDELATAAVYDDEALSGFFDGDLEQYNVDPIFTVHGDWSEFLEANSKSPEVRTRLDWAGTQVYAQDSSSPVFEQALSVVDATFDLDVSEPGAAFNTTSGYDSAGMGPSKNEHQGHNDWKFYGQSDCSSDEWSSDGDELSRASQIDLTRRYYTCDTDSEEIPDRINGLDERESMSASPYGNTDSDLNSEAPIQSRPRKYDENLLRPIKSFAPETIECDLQSLVVETFQGWFVKCTLEHGNCQTNNPSSLPPPLPSRVIDVGSYDQHPSLYITAEQGLQHAEYIALSYCWGMANNPAKTTTLNISSRTIGINTNELPKTLLDAIAVTRALGRRFLWVDAVCIIQACEEDGDLSDWRNEAPKMGQYYSNAWCTIAAANAEDSSQGFLRPRQGLQWSAERCHLGTSKVSDDGISNFHLEITFPPPIPRWNCDVTHSPLYQRGWTFQEQALSRRLLIFTRNAVYWECASAHWSEFDPTGTITQLDLSYSEDSGPEHHFGAKPEKRNMKALLSSKAKHELLGRTWIRMVEDYSKMRLTYETDRIVAFAGIVQTLQTIHGDRCVMGVWASQAIRHLVWQRTGIPRLDTSRPVTTDRFASPSWSWATLGTSVEFPLEHPEGFFSNDLPLYTKSLSQVLELTEAAPPETRASVAKIRGFVESIEVKLDDSVTDDGMNDGQAYGVTALAHTGEQVSIVFDDPSLRLTWGPRKLRCLLLVRRKGEEPDGEKVYFAILKSTKQRPGCYRRIGLGYVKSATKHVLEEQDFSPVQAFTSLSKSRKLSRRVIELE